MKLCFDSLEEASRYFSNSQDPQAFIDRFFDDAKQHNSVCIGLDTVTKETIKKLCAAAHNPVL